MRALNEEGRGLVSPDLQCDLPPTRQGQPSDAVEGANPDQLGFDSYLDQISTNARDTNLEHTERGDQEWADRVFSWIDGLEVGTELDADDVRARFGHSMAVGSVFRKASRAHLIEVVGLSESKAVTRHKGLQRVWRRV